MTALSEIRPLAGSDGRMSERAGYPGEAQPPARKVERELVDEGEDAPEEEQEPVEPPRGSCCAGCSW